VVFGPLLVLLVIFLPYGIVGTYLNRQRRKAAMRAPAAPAPSTPSSSTAAPKQGATHA